MTSEEYQMFMSCMREIRDAIDRNTKEIKTLHEQLWLSITELKNSVETT